MFKLIVLAAGVLVFDMEWTPQFSTQRDCLTAASAMLSVMPGEVMATCYDPDGIEVGRSARNG